MLGYCLAIGFVSIRIKVLSRYVKFFQSLLKSRSTEVRLVAQLAAHDKRSTTGRNVANIAAETGLNPWVTSPAQVREKLVANDVKVPANDEWRLPYLKKLLGQRHDMELQLLKTDKINEQIEIICSN